MEIEKVGHGFEALIPSADLTFISKDVSKSNGATSLQESLDFFKAKMGQGSMLVCTWGDQGASGIDRNGQVFHSAARPPSKIVDTLGAGDTFTASVIASLIRGLAFDKALDFGCAMAGVKIGQRGFANLTKHHLFLS